MRGFGAPEEVGLAMPANAVRAVDPRFLRLPRGNFVEQRGIDPLRIGDRIGYQRRREYEAGAAMSELRFGQRKLSRARVETTAALSAGSNRQCKPFVVRGSLRSINHE
jgi:hypothetical protein